MLSIDKTLVANWDAALQRAFPNAIPTEASWTQTSEIAKILRSISAPNTGHMFFPEGGGQDLTGVEPTPEGNIELHSGDPTKGAYVVKADSLRFCVPHKQPLMAYFLLKLSPLSRQPVFAASSNTYREEFAEIGGHTYTFDEFMSGIDGNGEDIPDNARRIMRYWNGGLIAVFAKASPYNDQQVTSRAFGFDAYEAYHMNAQEFEPAVWKLAAALRDFPHQD